MSQIFQGTLFLSEQEESMGEIISSLKSKTGPYTRRKSLYYLLQKYITKNENSSFIDKKRTNYCSIMDQHLVWYPLASMTAAILRGMDS